MINHPRVVDIEDYSPLIGEEALERILKKAKPLQDLHVVNVNSTYYGGGVAELLGSMTILMNSVGIKTGWRVIQGSPDFFSITKKMHNALQGGEINLTDRKKQIYEEVVYENAIRTHLEHDLVIIHDPQPLPMIDHYRKRGPWIWRGYVDLSAPNRELWNYFSPLVEKYDAAIFSIEEYAQKLNTPQLFFMPAIDPFSIKNHPMSEAEIDERLEHYNIPTDLPLVVQVSRFDIWKDPQGVVEAFRIARKEVDCTLVLLGNVATDDPEGPVIMQQVQEEASKDKDIFVLFLPPSSDIEINALQRGSTVVLQKSLKEGFGLTVSEAMWKAKPTIASAVGGIPLQIAHKYSGILTHSIEGTAYWIKQLINEPEFAQRLGSNGKEHIKSNFLITRHIKEYLLLFLSLFHREDVVTL